MARRLVTVSVGDTLHLFIGDSKSDARFFDRAIATLTEGLKPNGEGAVVKDGGTVFTVFVEDKAVVDTSREGAGMYTWDKSGNRAKHRRVRVRVYADGRRTEEELRTVYRAV